MVSLGTEHPTMRNVIRDFVKIVSETLPTLGPIYEFGSFQVAGQEDLANLRPFFQGMKYVGTDLREGPGVDVILNVHDIDLPSESVGTILCLDTLEHVEYPRKAIDELTRILKPGGMLVISSSMDFPIHDFPYDFWRFTPDGFKSLLKPYSETFVGSAGNDESPHTVVGIGFKDSASGNITSEFSEKIEVWKDNHKITQKKSWKRLLKITISPLRLAIYRKLNKKKS